MCAHSEDLTQVVRPTTVIRPIRLQHRLGIDLTIVAETFQHTGSFKFRAAFNLAANVHEEKIITASSGNFGQALAYAAALFGKTCIVVMPSHSAQVKIEAVREFGGIVDLVDVRQKTRVQRVQELALLHPEARIASAYDDPLIIEGNASLGEEIADLPYTFDHVVVPIGGGGLSSGIVKGLRSRGRNLSIVAAEPLLANDAARSFRAGYLVSDQHESATIADGARTVSLGQNNWDILCKGLETVIEVPDENITEAVRMLFWLANLKAEPTGALALAAVLTQPETFQGKSVCLVVSGGNVDPIIFQQILSAG